ncbi:amidase [Pontimonas sp.]|uniref:amidase n=1 Tax=Pontimonas sp. TaxID=2304492 RepID=UPI0028707D89|nr:amidase [Pontimonas sp.]MDR9396729.1 amidase [Pontimonas sp.]MDR9434308.1 amidase [Pontimonas sp.]
MTIWHQHSLAHQHNALSTGQISASELTEYYLQRIERFNPGLNAFVHVDPEYARRRAAAVDDQLAGPTATALTGLASADKDLVHREGMPTRYGSALTADQPPADQSDPMATWLDSVGAISVGKTATSEFGMAAASEALAMGPTKNPHDVSRSAGGSSGGAAAAVAAGMLPFAPGSDGGGSIRIPALSCGLVGWKPSRGLVPAGSGFEFLGGLAVPGLITRSVEDLALAADLLVRGDWSWATRAPGEPGSYLAGVTEGFTPRRIGWTSASPWPEDWAITPDPLALEAFSRARDALVDAGHELVECDWQPSRHYAEDFVTLWTANAASLPVPEEARVALEPLTRFLIEEGMKVSGVQLVRALAGLRSFEQDTISTFGQFDAMLTPGLNGPPPALGWYDQVDAWRNFRQQVDITPWTSFVNVAGLPAIAVPTTYSPEGLPAGAQLVGNPGGDATVMALAAQIESRLPEATRSPAGY